jgi:seryl-tRNA synthetase
MLDLKFIRKNPEIVKEAVKNKNEKADIDKFLALDEKRREVISHVEELKRKKNEVSKQIGQLKRAGESAEETIAEMRKLGDTIKELDEQVKEIEQEMNDIQIWIPNIPHDSTPIGSTDEDNVEIKRWGDIPEFDFEPIPHWELIETLNLVDLPGAAKITGSNFLLFKGLGAKLERALIQFMLDFHIEKHGYTEISAPFIVNRESMFGTGQLPKLEDDMYLCENEDYFLIPTGEVPVTNIFREETINEEDLPIYYVTYSPCFRREAGSYGKDTKGLKRVHQFDKVELVKFTLPERSYDEHERLLSEAEIILQLLKIPYRVRILCTGDLSFAAAKCYDIEAYTPCSGWLEVSSVSNFEDFQARRANIRYKPSDGGKTQFVHTLNGSGVALPRTVISILENYQTKDGKVIVPEVLREYMNVDVIG